MRTVVASLLFLHCLTSISSRSVHVDEEKKTQGRVAHLLLPYHGSDVQKEDREIKVRLVPLTENGNIDKKHIALHVPKQKKSDGEIPVAIFLGSRDYNKKNRQHLRSAKTKVLTLDSNETARRYDNDQKREKYQLAIVKNKKDGQERHVIVHDRSYSEESSGDAEGTVLRSRDENDTSEESVSGSDSELDNLNVISDEYSDESDEEKSAESDQSDSDLSVIDDIGKTQKYTKINSDYDDSSSDLLNYSDIQNYFKESDKSEEDNNSLLAINDLSSKTSESSVQAEQRHAEGSSSSSEGNSSSDKETSEEDRDEGTGSVDSSSQSTGESDSASKISGESKEPSGEVEKIHYITVETHSREDDSVEKVRKASPESKASNSSESPESDEIAKEATSESSEEDKAVTSEQDNSVEEPRHVEISLTESKEERNANDSSNEENNWSVVVKQAATECTDSEDGKDDISDEIKDIEKRILDAVTSYIRKQEDLNSVKTTQGKSYNLSFIFNKR